MKNLIIFLFLPLSLPVQAAIDCGRVTTNKVEAKEQVIHIQEVYKTVDTFELKTDIFYTSQCFEKENNTAIVFFHGGGWAFGTPEEFFAGDMKAAGNYFEQHMYEGRKHYLGDGNTKYSRYYDDEILKLTDDFLRKFKLLDMPSYDIF